MKENTTKTNATTDTRTRLEELANHRNEIIATLTHARKTAPLLRAEIDRLVFDLADMMAQIAVYKTLQHLSDNGTSLSASGADKCFAMLCDFPHDIRAYKSNDTSRQYSDAFDLYQVAFTEIWGYLKNPVPLTLADTVRTETLKNGNEKNYTLFATACKEIRQYINEWSGKDQYKKLAYVIGITDSGADVISTTRPQDPMEDITAEQLTAFFNKYGLTAKEQEILHLVINGEDTQSIATLLGLPLRTVQYTAKKAKAKFATATAYAEYTTARNAEKIAKAKAEKHADDKVYTAVYEKAKARTAKALEEWQALYHAEQNRNA